MMNRKLTAREMFKKMGLDQPVKHTVVPVGPVAPPKRSASPRYVAMIDGKLGGTVTHTDPYCPALVSLSRGRIVEATSAQRESLPKCKRCG
jgi:hypothetical protein